jgi:hypothetical protein
MTRAAAFKDWKAWAEAASEHVGTPRRLTELLRALEGVDETTSGVRCWIGIGLRPGAPPSDPPDPPSNC